MSKASRLPGSFKFESVLPRNITESKLAFRAAVKDPGYKQNDEAGCNVIWDLQEYVWFACAATGVTLKPDFFCDASDSKMVQGRGSVKTKQGRAIAFPNVFQVKTGTHMST